MDNNVYDVTENNQQSPQYFGEESKPTGSQGMAIASMVCGILSILLCCWWIGSVILSIVAVTLGIIAIVKAMPGKGMAIAGIITGAVGVLLTILFVVLVVIGSLGTSLGL